MRIGMWVRRIDQEGKPVGGILLVESFNGWIAGKWTKGIMADFSMRYDYVTEDHVRVVSGYGSVNLSDGTWAFPGELYWK